MLSKLKSLRVWLFLWVCLGMLGTVLLARAALQDLRTAFETDARIIHRLLSQQSVQHDAILATLALLQPERDARQQRLSSLYSQILEVVQRDPGSHWPDMALEKAESASHQLGRPVLADVDWQHGRYRMVLAATPASHALTIDLRSAVPWDDWPVSAQTSPMRVALALDGQQFLLQPGHSQAGGWRFDFRKQLAADSQPFEVVAERQVGWNELPWVAISLWLSLLAVALTGLHVVLKQRRERRRAEELLRLGQVARLNTLGELAAGLAHELNQPLTAVLASTQASRRLLDDDDPDLPTVRTALQQAAEQSRRASDVLARLRRTVERPDLSGKLQQVDLRALIRGVLYLLEPECQRQRVIPVQEIPADLPDIAAEPVALEQILHNLLMNALQALEQVPPSERRLVLCVCKQQARWVLNIEDSGPGIATEVLPHLFEPFFTTRDNGLGLGLSLCETLAMNMGASITAENIVPRGARFSLILPDAKGLP